MGSGANGSYGGNGGSQPYAPSYHVEKSMLEADIKSGVYHDGHYDKNPTAKNINEMINGDYVIGKNVTMKMPYVVDLKGNIIVGKRNGNGRYGTQTPHPTLIGGKDPQVKIAGILHIKNGKIILYDNQSGHYKPSAKSLHFANEAFSSLPVKLFQ